MFSAQTTYLLPVLCICAACHVKPKRCKTPSIAEELVMVQQRAAGATAQDDQSNRKLPVENEKEVNDFAQHCMQEIPYGMFHGAQVYDAAVRDLSTSEGDSQAIFVELGAFLGQSTCYMSWLLENSSATFDVIDFWGSAPPVPREVDKSSPHDMQPWEDSLSSWASDETTRAVQKYGKGDWQLAWFYYMNKAANMDSIANVVRGSSKDAAVLSRYQDGSVTFLYLDTSHDNNTITELELWWPKIRPGGRMCGDDYEVNAVKEAVSEYFVDSNVDLLEPLQWCVDKPE